MIENNNIGTQPRWDGLLKSWQIILIVVLVTFTFFSYWKPWQRNPTTFYAHNNDLGYAYFLYPLEVIKGDRLVFSDGSVIVMNEDATIKEVLVFSNGEVSVTKTTHRRIIDLLINKLVK